MEADLDGAARIARAAAEFDWTWTTSDVARFCEMVGWRVDDRGDLGLIMSTDLRVRRRVSTAFTDSGVAPQLAAAGQDIENFSTYVADYPLPARLPTPAEVSVQYGLLRGRLIADLGQPIRRSGAPDRPQISWEFANVVLFLSQLSRSVNLDFVNPLYQQWEDDGT